MRRGYEAYVSFVGKDWLFNFVVNYKYKYGETGFNLVLGALEDILTGMDVLNKRVNKLATEIR